MRKATSNLPMRSQSSKQKEALDRANENALREDVTVDKGTWSQA